MTSITQTPSYRVAFSMYVALGGDKTRIFDSVEDIYAEIDKFYGKGSRITTEELTLEITENTSQLYNDDTITGYKPVSIKVNVAQKYTDEDVEDLKEISRQDGYRDGYELGVQDGYAQGESDGYNDGYAEGVDDGIEDQKALLEEITIIDNGVYEKEDGYKKVIVEVPIPEIPVFETETLSVELTENGTYNYTPIKDGYSSVEVTVDVDMSGGSKPKIYNGFVLNNSTSSADTAYASEVAKIDFSKYDWSGVYDLSYFFQNFGNNSYFDDDILSNFNEHFNGKICSCKYVFNPGSGGGGVITRVPSFFNNRMHDCVDLSYTFYNQQKLSNVSNIENWDTSNVETTANMFYYCYALTSVPHFDTSNVTDMNSMFYNCYALTSVPHFDTSNVTDMNSMFYQCAALKTIPQFDTSKVTSIYNMFYYCGNLESLPLLDCSSIQNGVGIDLFASYSSLNKLTTLGGFKDLGKESSFTKPSYFIKNCSKLTKESVMNVINNLYDRAAAGYSVVALPFNAASLALLSDEEKAIATTKGWTLA